MSTVEEIKQAIEQLPSSKRSELARWLIDAENEAWDKQIAEDYQAGRLDSLIKEAETDFKAGRCKEWP